MSRKKVDMTKLEGAGSSARLIEREQPSVKTKAKLLPAIPVSFEERHKALKEAGATSLVYGHYIVEALREKLERDEQRS
ncbi:hypothetical protein [Aeromonas veronii]|uniref:hypothetical protein n=1 Tax=Aeromonas veronii TaxID=654 RepID=UPI00227A098A|nr:hypothetical protein [Aeromonas veronii]